MSNKRDKTDFLLEMALEEELDMDNELDHFLENFPEYTFSEEHDERMKRIFKMAERAEKRPARRRRFRTIAAGFVLAFCISTVTVTQVEAFRIPVFRFFIEMMEKSSSFGSYEETTTSVTKKFQEFEPTYSPSGFELLKLVENKDGCYLRYLNSETKDYYSYYYFSDIAVIDVDNENAITTEITISGNKANLIIKDNKIRIIMYRGKEKFYVTGTISVEEAKKILESVK